MKKIIMFVFLLFLSITILVVSATGIIHTSSVPIEEVEGSRTNNNELIEKLRINDLSISYDKDSNTYFYYVPISKEGKILSLNFNLDSDLKYSLESAKFNFVRVDYNKEYKFVVYNNDDYYESKIKFTNLPTMTIDLDDTIGHDDTKATYYLTSDSFTNNFMGGYLTIHRRGCSTGAAPKLSYRINIFKNNKYEKKQDVSLLGLYNGDSYILDAAYYDRSKIRNQVATNIWNSITTNSTEKGEYIELFINNQYCGLYILKEPVNKTKLGLMGINDNDNSLIINNYVNGPKINLDDIDDISTSSYNIFEIKYPNNSKYYSRSWKVFLNKIEPFYTGKKNVSYDKISKIFDMDDYINYYVFSTIINHTDGKFEKNMYYYMNSLEDDTIGIMPWDFDLTMGEQLGYNGTYLSETNDQYDSWSLTELKDKKLDDLIVNRYKKVRSEILTDEHIELMINKYYLKIKKGALTREADKWDYDYDINEEIYYVKSWLRDRLTYLDEKVGDYSE